ncbi:hypothetical protein C6W10_04380 [Plantactinospora sp. BB1]|nr:hypothetical protein C6W10_04380 [Plantactinospora sp. BB1]
MPSGRPLLAATLLVMALAGCSGSGEKTCHLIGVPEGIGVTVDAAVAGRVETGELTVCWNDSCQTRPVILQPSSRIADETCTGNASDSVCAARAEPTGEESGFVEIPDMPPGPVEVTVDLTDPTGSRIVDQTLTVDPKMTDSPGECGGVSPQGRIAVRADGRAYAVG